jgi:hypothetical protein
MKQDEIIEMAKQARFYVKDNEAYSPSSQEDHELTQHLEAFAKLVAEHEREKYKWDIHSCSPTCNRYVCVSKREAVLAEREACAKVAENTKAPFTATAIRARG